MKYIYLLLLMFAQIGSITCMDGTQSQQRRRGNLIILHSRSESYDGNRDPRALTAQLLQALDAQVAPIITTKALWQSMLYQSWVHYKPTPEATLHDWELYTLEGYDFVIAIPKQYKLDACTQMPHLPQDYALSIRVSVMKQIESPFLLMKTRCVQGENTSLLGFLQAVLVTATDPYHYSCGPIWTVYLSGHGSEDTITELSQSDFRQILHFFNDQVCTDILLYQSCFSGSIVNRTAPFLMEVDSLRLNYTVINPATNGSIIYANFCPSLFFDPISVQSPIETQQGKFKRRVAHLIPKKLDSLRPAYLTSAYMLKNLENINNLPYIRYPSATEFVPLEDQSIMVITDDLVKRAIREAAGILHIQSTTTTVLLQCHDMSQLNLVIHGIPPIFLCPDQAPPLTYIGGLLCADLSPEEWQFVTKFSFLPEFSIGMVDHMFVVNRVMFGKPALSSLPSPFELLTVSTSRIDPRPYLDQSLIATGINNCFLKRVAYLSAQGTYHEHSIIV